MTEGRSHRSRWMASSLACLAASVCLSGCGNKGGSTTCGDFLQKSAKAQDSTIAKMADDWDYPRDDASLKAMVVSYCSTDADHVSGDAIETVLSP